MLSTVKIVMKEFSYKRISLKEEYFIKNVAPIMKICSDISYQVHALAMRPGRYEDLVLPVECLKKVEKIILYGICCMPRNYDHSSVLPLLKKRI